MKIGIIGSGNVGGTLGARWARHGYEVIFSSRQPESAEMRALLAEAGPGARATTLAETAATCDLLVLATPWGVTREIVTGLAPLTGKILIDATNPLLAGLAGLEYANTTSGAEQIAAWSGGATVVKAFNTVGYNIMAQPAFGEARPVLFYCGDDAAAKATVRELAVALGFDAQDAGPLRQARLLEPFALLWISLAMTQGYGREMAFQLLRR